VYFFIPQSGWNRKLFFDPGSALAFRSSARRCFLLYRLATMSDEQSREKANRQDGVTKIDCHAHLIGISPQSGGYASPEMRRSIPFQFLLRKQGLHTVKDPVARDARYAEVLAAAVRASEIDKCVVLAFDQIFNRDGAPETEQTYLYIPNEYVRDVTSQYADCFLYGASVHPYRLDAVEELERVKADGARLVKLLPNSQGFDPSDSRIYRYYKKAAGLNLPLLFHCGYEHTIPAMNQQYGDPNRLVPALEMGVKVIIAHGGSSGRFHLKETFGDTVRLLQKYENCYADNSAMTNFWRSQYMLAVFTPGLLERKYGVSSEKIARKFLHGTDYPIPLTPFAFNARIPRAQRKRMKQISNFFDLDLAIKRAVGFNEQCFVNGAQLLG
jgi:uncharacterized protein